MTTEQKTTRNNDHRTEKQSDYIFTTRNNDHRTEKKNKKD
jgi:hypothetical protein